MSTTKKRYLLSPKRIDMLGAAIHNSVMDARVANLSAPMPTTKSEIDDKLYELEKTIWKNVKEALGLHPNM